MVSINIFEFTDYDPQALHEFILLQHETEFKIIIPRLPWEESNNIDLSVEFLHASYAGQLLGQLSTSFAYFVPCPGKSNPFYFEVTIPDLEKFSSTLHFIVQGYNYHLGNDHTAPYQDKAGEFLDEALDWDFEVHTRGIYQIAVKLIGP